MTHLWRSNVKLGQQTDGDRRGIGGLADRGLAGERGDVTLGAAGMCG
jgi:hypothetical protein